MNLIGLIARISGTNLRLIREKTKRKGTKMLEEWTYKCTKCGNIKVIIISTPLVNTDPKGCNCGNDKHNLIKKVITFGDKI